jgi:hypothetical protein
LRVAHSEDRLPGAKYTASRKEEVRGKEGGVVVDETKVDIEKVGNGMRRKAEGSTVVAWRQGPEA